MNLGKTKFTLGATKSQAWCVADAAMGLAQELQSAFKICYEEKPSCPAWSAAAVGIALAWTAEVFFGIELTGDFVVLATETYFEISGGSKVTVGLGLGLGLWLGLGVRLVRPHLVGSN